MQGHVGATGCKDIPSLDAGRQEQPGARTKSSFPTAELGFTSTLVARRTTDGRHFVHMYDRFTQILVIAQTTDISSCSSINDKYFHNNCRTECAIRTRVRSYTHRYFNNGFSSSRTVPRRRTFAVSLSSAKRLVQQLRGTTTEMLKPKIPNVPTAHYIRLLMTVCL